MTSLVELYRVVEDDGNIVLDWTANEHEARSKARRGRDRVLLMTVVMIPRAEVERVDDSEPAHCGNCGSTVGLTSYSSGPWGGGSLCAECENTCTL